MLETISKQNISCCMHRVSFSKFPAFYKMTRRLFPLTTFLLIISSIQAQHNAEWMRYPAISPDGRNIVFSYHGDLYKIPAKGGEATVLHRHEAHDFMPVWSHNSKWIAFASNRYGNFDIFIIAATGGKAQRLTWHSADEYPYDFHDQDKAVLFGSARMDAPANRQFPSEALAELYQVSVSGGRPKQLLTLPAEDAKRSKDGKYIIFHDRKARENPWRKHQVSSVARELWLYNVAAETYKKLSSFGGENRSPVFASDHKHIYYLSEKSGSFNVWQASLTDTSFSKQVTFFKDNPVRFLSIANDNTLCFGYNGQVYLKFENKDPVQLTISITSDQKTDFTRSVPVTEVEEMAVAPSGNEVAFIFRGEVLVSGTEKKLIKRITKTSETEAGLSFAPDGKKLIYASERNNKWSIVQAEIVAGNEQLFSSASQIRETVLIANENENNQPSWSPDGQEIAYIVNRSSLCIYNIATEQVRTILSPGHFFSKRENDQHFEWSPDGKWLLVQFTEQGSGNEEVGVVSTSGKGHLMNLTQSGFTDQHPRWAMNGKMISWQSDRQGLHSYANSSTRENDVYGIFTDAAAWENFKINSTAPTIPQPARDTIKKMQPGEPFSNRNHLWDNKERLTTRSQMIADALVNKEGSVLYHLTKTLKNYDLWATDLRTRESKMLIPLDLKTGIMKWDKEQNIIFILGDNRIYRIDPVPLKRDTVNTKTEITIDPAKERQAMFDHVWRRTSETFYTDGMHGADWEALKRNYQSFLSGINNNYDFAELLNELLGELNTSHTGASFLSEQKDAAVTASLGAFYDQQYNGRGIKIKEIIAGGPLDYLSYDIKAGAIIEAIDGLKVESNRDMAEYLNAKQGKKILLTINDGANRKLLPVKPVSPAEEADLLYKRWVKRNEEETTRRSNGEIGYVHLYRMNDAAYRNVYEQALGLFAKCKAIIIDTRFNRGGDLAPELAMFLSGKRLRDNATDSFLFSSEPLFRWTKPSIVLANEANYSDGHCFVYDYQFLQLGRTVGMPVPGSCTWMTGESLQDNTLSYSVPTLGVKMLNGKYMENYQTEPDIRVMNEYGVVNKGRDQQLEAAIDLLMADVKKK